MAANKAMPMPKMPPKSMPMPKMPPAKMPAMPMKSGGTGTGGKGGRK